MIQKVTKAVFPVAGLGTRFLPATKASPKEMLPVVDKPLIQYAVEEAAAAGITEMIFVTGRNKRAIEDHFDKAYELETELYAKNKKSLLDILKSIKPKNVECFFVRQAEALGLGHAVLCAERLVRKEPFAVILADDLLDADIPVMRQMADLYEEHGHSIIGVEKIDIARSRDYGMVAGKQTGNLLSISKIVEKPAPENAPSNLGVVGRYILTPAIFSHLRKLQPGSGGELQLTDAIASLLGEDPAFAYQFDGIRYDCGSKLGYLKATVQYALKHEEVGVAFRQFLDNRPQDNVRKNAFRTAPAAQGYSGAAVLATERKPPENTRSANVA
ncbi:UTP--glucose-1-phosphate uridylyltransferase GalU [Oxalobacter paraformigenes]|uniref:UTP--glucose-1-phosphate uridylyltransferase n=1 Tax=Oxalobacter paraformigenes TaxID=556268 RepID=C3X4C9_9BURK|nr:UTP--glucose-1-phosphate uridylyltransferase GalU [Oxalobacter paraformigenes]EEO28065.1 UTP-glucose-1-phosphate uridylyltransferase [Oxalobacter paraformigenes]